MRPTPRQSNCSEMTLCRGSSHRQNTNFIVTCCVSKTVKRLGLHWSALHSSREQNKKSVSHQSTRMTTSLPLHFFIEHCGVIKSINSITTARRYTVNKLLLPSQLCNRLPRRNKNTTNQLASRPFTCNVRCMLQFT